MVRMKCFGINGGSASEDWAVLSGLLKVLQKPKRCGRIAGKITRSDQAREKSLIGRKSGKSGAENIIKDIEGEAV